MSPLKKLEVICIVQLKIIFKCYHQIAIKHNQNSFPLNIRQVWVRHFYNPNYSEGKRTMSWRPAQANLAGPYVKNKLQPGIGWLTPVILATWEIEIRRILVRGQPGQTVQLTPSPK
jgi:hypothetical protein